ncbi:Alpha/beta hydrolase fold [Paramagnetospirillum magnetotacticum MS-1]|uniref:Alpha/beta hydrolase fold n=1 Tax=Paramagnetospirillum magnetotacticum MS-1 TaxID=272627 RepID=A0A0C2UEM3_PARME|nr:alpha/beta hydrolase [Paramagnetospirillum magnetotacticum]KIL99952.1 Alpha/beta hydrolase fold [Paramagnetospirillum magnetotacticum MS-1]
MTSSRSRYLSVMGRELHVTEWGDEAAPALVMWHGLARTGRDFDTLAAHFCDRYRVVCPDTLGRGLSGWSRVPRRDYTLAAYMKHALELLGLLGIDRVTWIGTSMGGALGMLLAAGPLAGRMDRLVMNDIGPTLNPVAVERIRNYLAQHPSFRTMTEFEAYLRQVYRPYGFQTDLEWRRMTETSARRRGDGRITPHYDPAVMRVFAETAGDYEAWGEYDLITCPTLVLRGAESDLLLPEVAQEMTRRGPKARLVTVAGCGHAPSLNVPEQIGVIEDFLA